MLALRRGITPSLARRASGACWLRRPLSTIPGGKDDKEPKVVEVPRGQFEVSIDRSGLARPYTPASEEDARNKSPETPLLDELRTRIEVQGPLTVAEYVREALTNPRHGYYMSSSVIGSGGDFITSPEISQMFGEMVALWCMTTWQSLKLPDMQYVELGPGKGTLVADILRATRSAQDSCDMTSVHLVEASPAFRLKQRDSIARALGDDIPSEEPDGVLTEYTSPSTGLEVKWYFSFSEVPKRPSFFIAHEFFDALPPHQFQYTDRGWCERLIDMDNSDGPHHLRYVLSSGPTVASRVLLKGGENIVQTSDGSGSEIALGEMVEICPDGWAVAENISKRIVRDGGAALIVDYGKNSAYADSLQGISGHRFVDPLETPGQADLSIYVDFASLAEVARTNGAKPFGAVTQGEFLKRMGIEARLASLLLEADEEQAQVLISSYRRLVLGGDNMGEVYKVLSILPPSADDGLSLTS